MEVRGDICQPCASPKSPAAFPQAEVSEAVVGTQATTVPLERRARLWEEPAATAVTLEALLGTVVWLEFVLPQARTEPSSSTARQWKSPTANPTALEILEGASTWENELSLQPNRRPGEVTPIRQGALVIVPAELDTTTVKNPSAVWFASSMWYEEAVAAVRFDPFSFHWYASGTQVAPPQAVTLMLTHFIVSLILVTICISNTPNLENREQVLARARFVLHLIC